jgi:ADP-dependent NAD(P)H-hydrate dehydratase / NAD(P)H-hydrate epimerase
MSANTAYYTASAVRELDRIAIEQHGIPAFELMQRAGAAALAALQQQWPAATRLLVCCGTGNNGGDGFVIAALAHKVGLETAIYLVGERSSIKAAALQALLMAEAQQVAIHAADGFPPAASSLTDTVVVDALLGTGLCGEVRPPFRRLIDAINRSGLPVVSADIPSGLCSDTGAVLGACVKADLTVTFIGRKAGLVLDAGPLHCGRVVFADLGVPSALYAQVQPLFYR